MQRLIPLALFLLTHAALAASSDQREDTLRLNDLQMLGTHNSYKQAISPPELALLAQRNPRAAQTLDYSHPPLATQLDAGARQLEIDVLNDPAGGRYADPAGRKLALDAKVTLAPFDATPLRGAGFKVLHVQDLDYRSHCATLTLCLTQVRAWSDAHPRHVPILIMMNLKKGPSSVPGGVSALPFDRDAFDRLDAEIRSVLPATKLITPDDVQGSYPTLRDAVLAGNWPTLARARGRFLFAMDEAYEVGEAYRGGRKNLEGRVFFVNAPETSPVAAYLTINDPIKDAERIRKDVAAGFLVRTRADADTFEARSNDTKRREAAFASGAQYVSTDYMETRAEFGPYRVTLPEVARCNPVRLHDRCGTQAIGDP
jgi:hypothetical protein